MIDESSQGDLAAVSTPELLKKIGMFSLDGEPQRSSPISNPRAFRELASRLADAIDKPYDLIVVRDLFGDRVLGYQLSLIIGKPVAVSYDQEGIIVLESDDSIEQARALIAADVHFTTQSIRAAASGIEQAGMEVAGAAILLRVTREDYPFPVWTLEDYT